MSVLRPEKNFSNSYDNSDWFVFAAGYEFDATWGTVARWKREVPHLQFMRAQTCWLESDIDDLQTRRRAAFAIARHALSPNDVPDQEMLRSWTLLGVESISPALADSICTLYNEPPIRTFGDVDANTAEATTEGFKEVYAEGDVNSAMMHAYRAALFTNIVAIIPYWSDRLHLSVITPDLFRYQPATATQEEELWILERDENLNLSWRVLTPKVEKRYRDGKFYDEHPHTLGCLPAILMKLTPSNDIYGAGMTEAAEINAWSNVIRYLSTKIGMAQAHSVAIASNLNLAEGTRIGPGHVIVANNAGGDPSTKPEFTYATPDGKFTELESFRNSVLQAFQRNQGLPSFMVDMTAVPPTGIALQVMQRRLNEKRKLHKQAIRRAELDLAVLISKIAKIRGRTLIFDAKKFSVEFVSESTMDISELQFDSARFDLGWIAPSTIAQKYLGMQNLTDAKALATFAENKNPRPIEVTKP